jgi:hypothetical protein
LGAIRLVEVIFVLDEPTPAKVRAAACRNWLDGLQGPMVGDSPWNCRRADIQLQLNMKFDAEAFDVDV